MGRDHGTNTQARMYESESDARVQGASRSVLTILPLPLLSHAPLGDWFQNGYGSINALEAAAASLVAHASNGPG
jgi:hypothetical protein